MGGGSDPLEAMRCADKCAVITGGATGIGYATAELLGSLGARCALIDMDEGRLQQAVSRLEAQGIAAGGFRADVCDENAVEVAFQAIVSKLGVPDILVNNAGIVKREASVDLALADWRHVLDVNLTGVFLCARIAARHMIPLKRGSIINISSIGGQTGGRMYPNPAYRASKGGVINLTRALAVEWAPHKIRVNSVAPGYVATELTRNITDDAQRRAQLESAIPLGEMATPGDIAWAIAFLVSPAARLITGQIVTVDGGVLA